MSFPRYPKYKDSGVEWLGDVPEGWAVSCLKHSVKDIYSGGTPETGNPEYWAVDEQDSIPWVAISDMTRASFVDRTEKQITRAGLASKRLRVLPKGTLLYSMYASLGKVAVLAEPATINQAILGIIPDSKKLAQSFLRYWLIQIERHLSLFSSSNTQDNLNAEKVRSLPLLVPTSEEQTEIAGFLDRETRKIDELVGEKRQLMQLLKEKRQAVISHAVTKGLNPHAPMKPSGIGWLGDMPVGWEVFALNRLVQPGRRITYGIVQPGERDENGRFMVRGQDYSFGWAKPETLFKVSDAVEIPYRRARLLEGDLVITIVGAGVGNVEVVPSWLDGANITQTTARISVDKTKADPRFVSAVLKGSIGRRSVELYAKGAAQPGLNLEHVRIFPITVPPLSEQREIADYIDTETKQFDTLTAEAQRAIDFLQERRTVLISAAVTGQIDVRQHLKN